MLGAVCHDLGKPRDDGLHRRPHPVDGPRTGGRGADGRVPRPPERPDDRRLRRRAPGQGHRRAPPEAARVLQVAQPRSVTARSGGWRRKWTSSCSRGSRCRTAAAERERSTVRRSTGFSSARARSASNIAPPEPIVTRPRTCSSSASSRDRAWARSCAASTNGSSMGACTTLEEGLALRRDASSATCRTLHAVSIDRKGPTRDERVGSGPHVRLRRWRSALGVPHRAGAGARDGTDRPVRGRCARRAAAISRTMPATATALGVTTDQPAEPRPGHRRRASLSIRCGWASVVARHRRREADFSRGSKTLEPETEGGAEGPTVKTRFSVLSPQVSLNFGRRHGWSYLSGGIGWARVHDRARKRRRSPTRTGSRGSFNYGGGARWFAKEHLAFAFDLRFYAISAQEATVGRPAYRSVTHDGLQRRELVAEVAELAQRS